MLNISPGQRWISTAEPELGLGTILRADQRQADIIFTDSGELKSFTHVASPLLRVRFDVGDSVVVEGCASRIDRVVERDGMLIYGCGESEMVEGALDSEQPMLPAALRLFVQQSDPAHCFDLRRDAVTDALNQTQFERYALALLTEVGFKIHPITEHSFGLHSSDGSTPLTNTLTAFTDSCFHFHSTELAPSNSSVLHADSPLLQAARAQFLNGNQGSACFMLDDSLPARSAVLETVFCNTPETQSMTLCLDAKGTALQNYTPSEQALFRARSAQVDFKQYQRSLQRLLPELLEQSRQMAALSGFEQLFALRLVVGVEFAAFGKVSR